MARATYFAAGVSVFLILAEQAMADEPNSIEDLMPLIAEYPKSMREDILFLSSHLKLLTALQNRDPIVPLEPMDPLLKGWPPNVQQAALKLAKEPEVLRALQADPPSTFAMGQIYLKNRTGVLADLQKEEQQTSAAVDEWTKRLGQDGEAVDQMKAAVNGYQKHLGGPNSPEDAANLAGVDLASNQFNVTALPTPGFAEYVMHNADVYPALANSMVSQWLGSRNSWAYDQSFRNWWHGYGNHFGEGQLLTADARRADRLADLARYDRKFAGDEHRWDKFDDRRNDFQHLAKLDHPPKNLKRDEHERDAHSKPNLGKKGEHHPKPVAGKHPTVKRTRPTEHKQAQHAAKAHQYHIAQQKASHHGRK
jgi:hypothetical protein